MAPRFLPGDANIIRFHIPEHQMLWVLQGAWKGIRKVVPYNWCTVQEALVLTLLLRLPERVVSCRADPLNCIQALALSAGPAGREAIGGEVAEESKVRNNCDSYDVSII